SSPISPDSAWWRRPASGSRSWRRAWRILVSSTGGGRRGACAPATPLTRSARPTSSRRWDCRPTLGTLPHWLQHCCGHSTPPRPVSGRSGPPSFGGSPTNSVKSVVAGSVTEGSVVFGVVVTGVVVAGVVVAGVVVAGVVVAGVVVGGAWSHPGTTTQLRST